MNSVSCSRILCNAANLAAEAAITVSAQRASTDIRLISQQRQGGGRMRVSGGYTGAADTDIDVEIVDGAAAALRTSAPIINGVGNGTLEVLSIDVAAVPETITYALLDAGDPAVPATLDFFGTTLAAAVPGADGNAITISVTRNIVATPMPFATLTTIAAGTSELAGAEYDWGQPAATDAQIPTGALRIRFAGFPGVHRAWKVWRAGQFAYKLDPATAYEIPADTRVESIAGDYTLTVTDGVTVETYTAVTVFDFASQLQARSGLVVVRGAVAADTAPGGMAVTDIPLRTDAHALPQISSLRASGVRLQDIVVAPTAPTENIVIRCKGTSTGAEAWSVTGGVSGNLPDAVTGVAYDNPTSPVAFTIPARTVAVAEAARISAKLSLVDREEGEGLPAVCFKPLKLGALARDMSVTFRYEARPKTDCACANMPPLRVSDAHLGLTTEDAMALDAEHLTRLIALYAWQADFVATNAAIVSKSATEGRVTSDTVDVELARSVTAVLATALGEIYATPTARAQWDTYFDALQLDLSPYEGLRVAGSNGRTARVWSAEIAVNTGQLVRPTTPNGRLALVVTGGQCGTAEPDWGSATNPIEDGEVRYELLAPYWSASAAVSAGQTVEPGNGIRYRAAAAGTSGTTEPYWLVSGAVSDGDVSWEPVAATGKQLVDGYTETTVDGGGGGSTSTTTPATIEVLEGELYGGTGGRIYRLIVATGPRAGYMETILPGADSAALVEARVAARKLKMAREFATVDVSYSSVTQSITQTRVTAGFEVEPYVTRLATQMDHCRAIAGIVPKSNASAIESGDGSWRDQNTTHWWVPDGDYLPAFTNVPYVSARRGCGTDAPEGEIYSTKEFGFGIVTPCGHRLKEGDTFTITITGTGTAAAYAEGDTFTIPLIAAAGAPFSGGEDGDATQTWTVRGSASGVLPDWLFDPTDPTVPYTHGPLDVRLTPGGIPFGVGDAITVRIEGGRVRWRRDGGAWSEGDLYGASHALGDGLVLDALPGAAPSFVAGDTWRFRAVATFGTSRMRRPRVGQAYGWDGDAVQIDIDLGAVLPVESVMLGMHTLPATAVVTVSAGDAAIGEWTDTPAVGAEVVLTHRAPGTTARYLRIAITGAGAAGAALGWLFVGVGWQPTVGASDLRRLRQYGLTRGQGLNAAAAYRGRGWGGVWTWSMDAGAVLIDACADDLVRIVDHVAEAGLEPLAFIADVRNPERSAIGVLEFDEIELPEFGNWQHPTQAAVSATLPFRGVIR